jgi:hypothetical protein
MPACQNRRARWAAPTRASKPGRWRRDSWGPFLGANRRRWPANGGACGLWLCLPRLARGAVHGASHERDRYGATCNCEVPMNGGMKGGSVMKLPSVPV